MKKLLLILFTLFTSCKESPKKLFQLPTLDSQETCVRVEINPKVYYKIWYYNCQNKLSIESGFSSSTIMVKENTMIEYKGNVEFNVISN